MKSFIELLHGKPFNLKAALKGKRFRTRGGDEVIDFYLTHDNDPKKALCVTLKNKEKGTTPFVLFYEKDGRCCCCDYGSPYDLVMQ